MSTIIRRHSALGLLLLLYISLALGYSYTIRFGKGPDEWINYEYIHFIAQHRRLPATIAEQQAAGVKADWQPLYHLVAGLAATTIPLEPTPALKVTWEPATRQLIDIELPRATLIRTEDERAPYWGVYLVWWLGRKLSLLLGAGTLIITYLIGVRLWPEQPLLAASLTALLVFTPRFLFTHAVLSDDTMLGFWLALFLALLLGLARGGQRLRGYGLCVGLGLTAGLAIVTKYTAVPAVPEVMLVGGLLAYRYHWPVRAWGQRLALFGVGLLLGAGWWFGWVWWHFNRVAESGWIRGLLQPLLPGAIVDENPTTARLTALLSGQSLAAFGTAPGAEGNYLDWAWHMLHTLWAITVFGAEPGRLYPYWPIMAVMALFCLAAVIGLGRAASRAVTPYRFLLLVLGLHVLLFLPLPLLRFTLSRRLNDAAQGRHLLFPAGVALMALLLVGYLAWVRPQWRGVMGLALGGAMLAWGPAHLFYLAGAYPGPLPVRTTAGPQLEVAHPVEFNFGPAVRLTGYDLEFERPDEGPVLRLDLLWHSLAPVQEDYQTELTLLDGQGQAQLRWISHPAGGRFPTRAWQAGDWVRDVLHLPLVGLSPGRYRLQLALLGWEKPLEKVSLTDIDLPAPLSTDQLVIWQAGRAQTAQPAYRYRATIPVTLTAADTVSLVGPDGQIFWPLAAAGSLRVFVVGHTWPSGLYQVRVNDRLTDRTLQVENFDRRYNQPWNFTPPEMMVPVQANFDQKIELLGYDLPIRRVKAGEGIPLVLYWRGVKQMKQDYVVFVQLLDATLARRGGYDRFPRETYNTYLWVPDEVVDDGFAVPVDPTAPNGVYTIRIGWYEKIDNQPRPLPLVNSAGETSLVIGPVKVGGPPPGLVVKEFSPQQQLDQELGGVIRLRGYDLALEEKTLRLVLYWESVAQRDRPPVDGQYPTGLWEVGEQIPDGLTLDLPPDVKPGRYEVVAGLYNPQTGVRLDVPGRDDDTVLLTELRLE